MRFDQQSIMWAQRKAFIALTSPKVVQHANTAGTTDEKSKVVKIAQDNKYFTPAKLITTPAVLVQELPWINTTQTFTFDFSLTAPPQVPGVNNNVNISKNDVVAGYAIQILFGTGEDAATRIYRSFGVLPADDSLYNSVLSMNIESSTLVTKMNGLLFRDVPNNSTEFWGETGMQIINPLRIVSGEQGKLQIVLNLLNPIAGLVISDNTFISMRFWCVYGQAQS